MIVWLYHLLVTFPTVTRDRLLNGLTPAIKYFCPEVTQGFSTLNLLARASNMALSNCNGAATIILSHIIPSEEKGT